jgi:hypothetical protein
MPPLPRFYVSLLCLLLVLPAWAYDPTDPYSKYRNEENEFDETLIAPWVESEAEVPPLPPDDELVALQLDQLQPGLRAYTHPATISLDRGDRVLRFWLVLKGKGGGYNATYEGLRCNTGEYKIYAYGSPHRAVQVKPVPDPKWRSLGEGQIPYRLEAARSYFCSGISPKTVHQIVTGLRGGRSNDNPYSRLIDF